MAGGRGERGSAAVGFALTAPLVLAIAVAVIQIVLTMHVRTALVSAAAEGARAQARAVLSPGVGERRARMLAERSLAAGLVEEVVVRRERVADVVLSSVHIRARLPWLGVLVPIGIAVDGHALEEPR